MNDKDNKILSAAYDSFIRYGVKRTTMGDVAQAAGVSRPTLYASYPNKEELLGGCCQTNENSHRIAGAA